MGSALAYMGRAQEAEAHVLEALRLSPRDAMIFEWFLVAGSAKMLLGEFAEASAWLRKSIDANRNRPLAFFLLAACLAHLGRLDEARREVKAGLTVDPDLTLRRFRAGAQSDNAVYLAQRARVRRAFQRDDSSVLESCDRNENPSFSTLSGRSRSSCLGLTLARVCRRALPTLVSIETTTDGEHDDERNP